MEQKNKLSHYNCIIVMSKWTKEEELDLIKDIANGLQIEHIAIKRNRSNSAIELRLKKIIYENVIAGRSLETMAKKLRLPEDKVRQYFYSYKDFKEKHSGNLDDITNLKTNYSDVFGEHKHEKKIDVKPDKSIFSKLHREIEQIKENTENCNEEICHREIQLGGSRNANLEEKIKKLELENKFINLIVENKQLNSQINKLIKEGKVDKSVKLAIKNIRDRK